VPVRGFRKKEGTFLDAKKKTFRCENHRSKFAAERGYRGGMRQQGIKKGSCRECRATEIRIKDPRRWGLEPSVFCRAGKGRKSGG